MKFLLINIFGLIILYFVTGSIGSTNDKKIVCYYGTWATYRNGNGKYDVGHINPNLCTHIIYAFFGVRAADASLVVLDPGLDLIDNWGRGNIDKFNKLKNQNSNLKTLAAIGGWNVGSGPFSNIAKSDALRKQFANNAAAFCIKHGFDGLDVDWEYPAQRDGNAGIDKANFVEFLKELRIVFDTKGLLLTAAVASAQFSASISYDIPNVHKYLDFINVMTYDLHGSWDNSLGIHSPLYANSRVDVSAQQKQLNVNACIQYWLSQGTPKEKLIMGIPFYGRTFTLQNPSNTGIGSASIGPGNGGRYTAEPGMMGYHEFCELQLTTPWKIQWESEQQVPYASNGNQWIGYDNLESVTIKANYIMNLNLGGAMIYSIETDDYHGICGQGDYPLLRKIYSIVKNGAEVITSPPVVVTTTTKPPVVITTTKPPVVVTTTKPPVVVTTTKPPVAVTTTKPPVAVTTTTKRPVVITTVSSGGGGNSGGSGFNCIKDGWFVDPNDCSWFYVCANGVYNRLQCPSGLVFDTKINGCNWKAYVKC